MDETGSGQSVTTKTHKMTKKEALEVILDAADSFRDDLSSGIEEGIYEEGHETLETLEKAIDLFSGETNSVIPEPKLIINMDGGLVQSIRSNVDAQVLIVDYDIEGDPTRAFFDWSLEQDDPDPQRAAVIWEEVHWEPAFVSDRWSRYRNDEYMQKEEDEDVLLLNKYKCAECGHEWEDEWSCACDDKCTECGTAMTPYESEDVS